MAATAETRGIDVLQIVFKVVERCNIDCTYCYYYHGGDRSAMDRPPKVSRSTAATVAEWAAIGCQELAIGRVVVSFHGGEPMLLKPRDFANICTEFSSRIISHADLDFLIQTNGTILNQEWLEAFEKFRVHVGVSIDGTKDANDRYRLDYKLRSTFDTTFYNLQKLVNLAAGDPARLPSTISVLDYRNDYKKIYNFLRQIGILEMSFLLPDKNADSEIEGGSRAYGRALCQIFEAWMEEDNPDVHVRQIDDIIRKIDLSNSLARGKHQIIIVQSNGNVAFNDSLIPTLDWYKSLKTFSIAHTSLEKTLNDPLFAEIEAHRNTPALQCRKCKWLRLCGGGDLENRFSRLNGFDNPSVYCDGLMMFFEQSYLQLVRAGYPVELLDHNLFGTSIRQHLEENRG